MVIMAAATNIKAIQEEVLPVITETHTCECKVNKNENGSEDEVESR